MGDEMSHSKAWQEQEADRITTEAIQSLLRLRSKVGSVDMINDQWSLVYTELKIVQEELSATMMYAAQMMVLD